MHGRWIVMLALLAATTCGTSFAQLETPPRVDSAPAVKDRLTALPTDRVYSPLFSPVPRGSGLLSAAGDPLSDALVEGAEGGLEQPLDIRSLMRPRVELQLEWEPIVDGLGIWGTDVSVQVPTYPIGGPPPPLITWGYSWTEIASPMEWQLPNTLHDVSLGLAWARRINDRWMARFMLSSAFASDWENTSSAAWQIRGGAFAMYSPNDQWNWAFGALATGRDDLPVIPAVGLIWRPDPNWNVNLMFPTPRISRLIWDTGTRQHWAYFGSGFTGGTWAYADSSHPEARITYREWRALLGWETTPPLQPGEFRPTGTKFNLELGYVFGREFEFEGLRPEIAPSDGWLLRTGLSF